MFLKISLAVIGTDTKILTHSCAKKVIFQSPHGLSMFCCSHFYLIYDYVCVANVNDEWVERRAADVMLKESPSHFNIFTSSP